MPPVGTGEKKKLTLSVDSTVVEKAKGLGLNISEITESVLRGFTFAPSATDKEAEYQKYRELFDIMLPLLKEYQTSVKVANIAVWNEKGEPITDCDVYLSIDGSFWFELFESSEKDIHGVELYSFFEPKTILQNLIDALARTVEKRKERMEALEMAKGIVAAISSTLSKTASPPGPKGNKRNNANQKAAG